MACLSRRSSPLGTTNSFAGHDRGRDFRRHQGRRGVWTAGVLDIRRGSKRPEDAEGGGKIPSAAEGVEKFRLARVRCPVRARFTRHRWGVPDSLPCAGIRASTNKQEDETNMTLPGRRPAKCSIPKIRGRRYERFLRE